MNEPYSGEEHRLCQRHLARPGVTVSCNEGELDFGPNLALALVDVSEAGVGLLLTSPVEPGKEVSMSLKPQAHGQAIKRVGTIVWCSPAEGGYRAGVRFRRRLDYADVFGLR